jgi:glycosyltransferase involved in cell wall biosynthesis
MRLLYAENIRLPTEKAHGYQIMKTCEAMAKAGIEIELVTAARKNPIKQNPFEFFSVPELFKWRQIPVLDFVGSAPSVLKPFAYAIERGSFVRNLAKRLPDSDAYYTRDLVVADAIGMSTKKPLFVELHDMTSRVTKLVSRVTAWIVISEGIKQELLKLGVASEKILTAHDGFDPAQFANLPTKQDARIKLGVPSEVFLLVYTGHLYPWKGMDGIAAAFKNIPEGIELAVVGGYPEDILRIQETAGDTSRVRFLGQLSRAEVPAWLAAADAALLPTSAKFEIGKSYTSPLKLFEYLAAGLSVVASDVPSSHEILDESVARFFKPDDGQDFLRALNEIRSMGSASDTARAKAKPYAWEERGKSIAAFLKSYAP